LVQEAPHVAFQVDDLEAEIAGKEVLIPPNSPSPGVRVAFIVDDERRWSSCRSTRHRRRIRWV